MGFTGNMQNTGSQGSAVWGNSSSDKSLAAGKLRENVLNSCWTSFDRAKMSYMSMTYIFRFFLIPHFPILLICKLLFWRNHAYRLHVIIMLLLKLEETICTLFQRTLVRYQIDSRDSFHSNIGSHSSNLI